MSELPDRSEPYDEHDEYSCVDPYPEHDYRLMGDEDGIRTYVCRRCDAEYIEDPHEEAS